jgi:hypothetical protein
MEAADVNLKISETVPFITKQQADTMSEERMRGKIKNLMIY